MSTLRSRPIWLLALCLVVLTVSNTATAKKPTSDPPPEPPALYEVVWLDGMAGYEYTYANDINVDGTIVGTLKDPDCSSRAVYWEAGLGGVSKAKDLTLLVGISSDTECYLSCAERISNRGLIAGCHKDASGDGNVFVWNPNPDPDVDKLRILNHDAPFSIRDMNDEGTVVGYFLNDAEIKQGFVWYSQAVVEGSQTGIFVPLPEYFLPSGINDDGWVVGIFGDPKSNLSGEVFEWHVDSDPETDVRLLGATAVLFAPANGRLAISNNGTIAATASAGRLSGAMRLQLVVEGPREWELLTDERGQVRVCDINNIGQICGKCNPQKPQLFPGGFVYDEIGEKFWLLDERIVFDDTEGSFWWVTDSLSALPRAVADPSDDTAFYGFSLVVGWKGGDSFVLVPVYNSDYTAP
jgi:hypothetical protein